MISMFASLLGLEQTGATDNFFDLGGNSLQAMRLISMLGDELGVDVGAMAVFLSPTPRQLAALLRDEHGLPDTELSPAEIAELEQITGDGPDPALAGVD